MGRVATRGGSGIATSPPHQFEQMVPTPPIIPLLAPIALALVRMWGRHEREWPPLEFHCFSSRRGLREIDKAERLGNKPFIICAQSDNYRVLYVAYESPHVIVKQDPLPHDVVP